MLKQTPVEPRTIFLKLFTQELISNSKPEIEEKKVEKPKVEEAMEKRAIESGKLEKPIEIKRTEIKREKLIPSVLKFEEHKPAKPIKLLAPVRQTGPLRPATKPLESLQQVPAVSSAAGAKFTMPISTLPKIDGEVSLGKLSIFLLDNEVTEVECPGPGKFIFARKAGQVNLTKITLSQEEINEIIKSFSEKARIPVISGVFKTSVGNLTITAIISEFVGSRFIIYKASPYSLIEQQARQLQQAQLQGRLLYKRRLKPQF